MTGPVPPFPLYAFMLSADTTLLLLRWALIIISNNKTDGNKSTGEKIFLIRLKTERMNPEEKTTKSYHYDLTLLNALCREGGFIGRFAAKMLSPLWYEVS